MGASGSEPCYPAAMKRVPERLTANARDLRNHSTRAERLLWLRLRQYRPRFTRQLVVGPFIVDLACREAKLAVELDGSQHVDATTRYDNRRTRFLEEQGWVVLRLWNNDVIEESRRRRRVGSRSLCATAWLNPPPTPPFQGGEDAATALPQFLPFVEGRN